MSEEIKEIDVLELSSKIKNNEKIVLLDVRSLEEYNHSNIPESIHEPLDQLENQLSKYDSSLTYILQCRSGGRSFKAAQILKSNGFNDVYNLKGGLLDWSDKIDPSIEVF